jgi:hypothetical protein
MQYPHAISLQQQYNNTRDTDSILIKSSPKGLIFLLKTCNVMPNFETVDINLHFEQISVHIAL